MLTSIVSALLVNSNSVITNLSDVLTALAREYLLYVLNALLKAYILIVITNLRLGGWSENRLRQLIGLL